MRTARLARFARAASVDMVRSIAPRAEARNPARKETAISLTREISAFADALSRSDIPADVNERGKAHILDSLGLALTGARAGVVRILKDDVLALRCGHGRATVLGDGQRLPPRFAALINATAMHADNFDDTNPQESPDRNGGIHATAPVLAATLAVAEHRGVKGGDMLTAFHAGLEVACRLNHAIGARHYEEGFHSTATLSAFGAAVAAAKLMECGTDGIVHAIAGVASRAGGVRRNFGAMVEQMHPGQAAEDGIIAAELAERGLSGATDALEGRFGYLQAAGGGFDAETISGRLGGPWALVDPGTWIKPFPNGALTHPAMTLLSSLVQQHDICPEQVARIAVKTNGRMLNTLVHHQPETAMQAKFSMEFSLAVLLLYGKAGLAEFTDAVVGRPEIRDMIARIEYGAFDAPGPDYANVTTLLEIELTDGSRLDGRSDFAKGSTRDPMNFADVSEKFRQCADYADWPDEKTSRIIEAVSSLENLDDLSELTRALAV